MAEKKPKKRTKVTTFGKLQIGQKFTRFPSTGRTFKKIEFEYYHERAPAWTIVMKAKNAGCLETGKLVRFNDDIQVRLISK